MAPRRSRGAKKRGGRLWAFLVVALLAAGAGFLVAHLLRDQRPERRPVPERAHRRDAEAAVREILGRPLDPSGTAVSVRDRAAAEELLSSVERVARRDPEEVSLARSAAEKHRLRARLQIGAREYPIELRWAAPPAPEPERRAVSGARLAVVIDDLGADVNLAKAFLDLAVPVTPAVIPHLPASLQVAHLARERDREFLLHLPMQPQGYPKVKPGAGALLEGMPEGEVRRLMAEALSSVPGASGVNNHMGSRLTELQTPMTWVMDELRKRELYFLDSATSGRSLAASAAREAGIGWARRDVFLDNEGDVAAVTAQIGKAVQRAKAKGVAIAIGHPHRATLEALKAAVPRFQEEGVEVVPLGQLIRRGEG